MANMGYCRFSNTLSDLIDCQEHMDDKLPRDEFHAREKLIQTCREIAEEYNEEQDFDPADIE